MAHPQSSLSQQQINLLIEKLLDRLDDLFAHLGVDLQFCNRFYTGCCPVHGGDNPTAFKLFLDGYSWQGNWVCNTRHCQDIFLPSLLGLVRGLLSAQQGWTAPGDTVVPFPRAVDYCLKFLRITPSQLVVNPLEQEQRQFIRQVNRMGKVCTQEVEGWGQNQVRSWLNIPSTYYSCRGYPAALLNKYDVGELRAGPQHPLFERVGVPVYDPVGRKVIGLTARSLHERCASCSHYHNPRHNCPQDAAQKSRACKWLNTRSFAVNQSLYNFWFAADAIRASGTVFLCEGPGDVWRMVEAGFLNVVGLYGCQMEDGQQILLETSGADRVVLLLDVDEAGQGGMERIKGKLSRLYRVYQPTLNLEGKDIGGTPADQLQSQLHPLLDKLR